MDGLRFTFDREGFIAVAKPDEKGFWVYGIGRDIPAPADPKDPPHCTYPEAWGWYQNTDYPRAVAGAAADFGDGWAALNEVRKAAFTDMAFEMGKRGLAGFPKMLAAARIGAWQECHDEALDSEYGREVSARARMVANMLLTGEWPA